MTQDSSTKRRQDQRQREQQLPKRDEDGRESDPSNRSREYESIGPGSFRRVPSRGAE